VTSALFGPDGTQLPEPATVLPDPLVGPGTPAEWPPLPTAAPPPAPDQEAVRRAVEAALAQERTPPTGFPAQRPPQPPQQHRRPPPSQRGRQPALRAAVAPAAVAPAAGLQRYTSSQHGYPPAPPTASMPAAGLQRHASAQHGYPPAVAPAAALDRRGMPVGPPRHRERPAARNPLIQERRSVGAGGWIGCLAVLIFFVAVTFNVIEALVRAVIDLVS